MPRPTPLVVNQALDQLAAFSWRGIEFPITHMSLSMQQDLATHSMWGRDGERQEATGRKSLVINASIPFRNKIVPGKSESWGALYPTTFVNFFRACADRSTGILVHPELGGINAKVRSVETNWLAEKRDGCDVEVSWVETLLPASDGTIAVTARPDPQDVVLDLESNFRELARQKGLTALQDLKFGTGELSFQEAIGQLNKIGDSATLLENKFGGQIEKVGYALDSLEDSVTRPLKTASAVINKATLRTKQQGDRLKKARDLVNPDTREKALASLGWPIRRDINRLRAALADLKDNLLATGQAIVFYQVATPCSMASILPHVTTSLGHLIALNPDLVRNAIVPSGTIVRYYTSADS